MDSAVFVVGTAGHVDHGKSALVEALTGTHPDRLREERERGLTIELGFAWLTLPSSREVSVVDVPGHVRFVRHMLAGVGAIDLALVVVAADEGIMQQTREHLEILDLLEVPRGVVALTKCDLVEDEEWLTLVEEDVAELLAPTRLAGAPLVRVSAVAGSGLQDLTAAIDAALAEAPPPRDIGRPRLGVDRVFTMSGFGTVVTGTLLDGRLSVGDAVEAVPGGPQARIRGLQTHRHELQEAEPGSRVAVNLAGVATERLRRGQVLAPPGRLAAARTLDARVRALADRPLRHNLRVAVHVGADEVQGRVRVLGGEQIAAGEEGWCQLLLTEPVAAAEGDLFVLRVSDRTIAGGRVVALDAPRHRRTDALVLERLAAQAQGTPMSRVLAALERVEPATRAQLAAAVELPPPEREEALAALIAGGEARELPVAGAEPLLLSTGGVKRLLDRARRALDGYRADHPLRFAMPREELRGRVELGPREFTALFPALVPPLMEREGGVAVEGWEPRPTAAQRRRLDEAAAAVVAAGLAPPRLDLDVEELAYLEGSGTAVDCGDGVLLARSAFEEARDAVAALIEELGPVTLAQVRDRLGTNRRAAQALLETLDRRRVTRRAGEARVLVAASEGASEG